MFVFVPISDLQKKKMTLNEAILDQNEEYSTGEKGNPEKLLFFLLGNAALLAFNIIINAVDIYASILNKSGDYVGTLLNRTYNIPCSITALLLCFIKPKNLKITLYISLSSVIVLTCILPIFLLVDMPYNAVFYGTLVIIGIVAVFSSVTFSSSFSFAAQYRDGSVPYVSSGNGLCGVIAAGMRLVTKAIKDTAELNSVYFFLAAAIYLFTLIYFAYKAKMPHLASKLTLVPSKESQKNTKKVLAAIWPEWLSVFVSYCITLSLFPGYLMGCKSNLGSWTPIIITTIFCIFDWVGRSIPSFFPPFPSLKFSWIPIALRLLFYPIFILSIQRVISVGDPWWTFSWDVVFALSNGYFGTVCMIYGNGHPSLETPEDKQFAGFLMPFAVNAGILAAMGLTAALPTPPQ